MNRLNKYKNYLYGLLLDLQSKFVRIQDKVHNDLPYYSQFSVPDFAEKMLIGETSPLDDPDWQLSGAESPEEYQTWVTTVCGMACTAMAIDYFYKQKHLPITLAKDALTYDVYRINQNHISSMRYREYVGWVSKFNIEAVMFRRLTTSMIRLFLHQGALVMISVNPNIRVVETVSGNQKGGHLVLVIGYNLSDDTFTIHNPSGFTSNNSHAFHTISSSDLKKYFAGRGIALFKN